MSLKTAFTHHRRSRSNITPGDLPPIETRQSSCDTTTSTTTSPNSSRRNSDGSPRVPVTLVNNSSTPSPPPDINIFAPSPSAIANTTSHHPMPTETTTTIVEEKYPSSRSASPIPHVSDPQPTLSSTSAVSRLFAKKPRSRGSSLSNHFHNSDSVPAPTTSSVSDIHLPIMNHSNTSATRLRPSSPSPPPPTSSATAPPAAPTPSSSVNDRVVAPGTIASVCGVELANAKRNQDFHALFRSVPEEDPLIEDFGCALQKEILLQGRIYISENHICFNANIFGWVTNLVIAFTDIVEIEKRTTALFIPNAIQISTLQAKHFLTSFLSRDQAYDLIVDVWQQTKAPENDKNENGKDPSQSASDIDDETDTSSDDYSYTSSEEEDDQENHDDDNTAHAAAAGQQQDRQSSLPSLPLRAGLAKKSDADALRRRAISEAGPQPPNLSSLVSSESGVSATDTKGGSRSSTPPVPPLPSSFGSSTTASSQQVHEKTECACLKSGDHYPKVVLDQSFPCTIEVLYNLLYQGSFMKKFLTEQKNTDLTIGDWQKDSNNTETIRELSYTKPLNGSIGPKSTKCLLTEEIMHADFGEYVTQVTTTRTPDVPSGGSFSVKTKTCLMWAGQGQVRMLVTVLVDFTKTSWLKGTIESASISGQEGYYKELDAAIRKQLSKPSNGDMSDRKKRKQRKGKRKHRAQADAAATGASEIAQKDQGVAAKAMSLLSDGIGWMITNASVPSASQATVFCMLMLVIINLFIANKMAQVDRQLELLKRHPPSSLHRYGRQHHGAAENELWSWLSNMDPDHRQEARVALQNEHDAMWSARLHESRAAKAKLDEHMDDLEQMIQRAGNNMEQVTKMVNQQRQRIMNNWTA